MPYGAPGRTAGRVPRDSRLRRTPAAGSPAGRTAAGRTGSLGWYCSWGGGGGVPRLGLTRCCPYPGWRRVAAGVAAAGLLSRRVVQRRRRRRHGSPSGWSGVGTRRLGHGRTLATRTPLGPIRATDQVAHDRVGQQPAARVRTHPVGPGPERPVRGPAGPGSQPRPASSRTSTGSPSTSRVSSRIRSTRRVSGSQVTSRAAAGLGARRRPCEPRPGAGCLTFQKRTPPTCECAPGPTPHQSPPRQ